MHDEIIKERLYGLINDLEKEMAPMERQPLVVIPKSQSGYEDVQIEFNNFNSFNWNRVKSRNILENMEPYISLPVESFFFLLPKFFRIVLRELGKTELVDTFFDMFLRQLANGYGEKEIGFSLTPRQIRLIYTIAFDLEYLAFQQVTEFGAVKFLEKRISNKTY